MRFVCLLISAVLLALTGHAGAQNWPAKSVRFIVPQSPGTLPDLVLRWVAERLARNLGQPFVIENSPGAGGLIGAQTTLRAGPDGYTYFLAGGGMIATDRHIYKSIPYDSDRDFVPVAMVFDNGPFVIAVHPDVPARNLSELIALAKAQPGKLSSATTMAGVTIIIGQWFNKLAGTDIVSVTYKDTGTMVQDFVAGRTQVIFSVLFNLDPHMKAGKARALAVTSESRFPGYPDLPAATETLPGFKLAGIGLLVVPTGTPADIVQRLNREIDVIVRDPKYTQYLLSFGWSNSGGARSIPGLLEFMRIERERWNEVFKLVKFEPQ